MGSGPRGALEPLQVVLGALVHGALVFPLLALFVVGTGSQHYPGDYYPDYPAYEDYQYPEDSPPPPLSLTTVNSSFSVTCGEAAVPLTHDGVEVDLGLRAVVTQTGFRVRPVKPEDWGVWECGGEETGVAVLPTLGRPHLLEGAGRLLNPGSELRVTEGRLLHFSCALLALKPGPFPQWPPTWTLAGEEKKGEDIGDGPGLRSRLPALQVGQSHNQRHPGGRPSPRVHHRSRAWFRQPLARGQPGHLALHGGGETCKLPVLGEGGPRCLQQLPTRVPRAGGATRGLVRLLHFPPSGQLLLGGLLSQYETGRRSPPN